MARGGELRRACSIRGWGNPSRRAHYYYVLGNPLGCTARGVNAWGRRRLCVGELKTALPPRSCSSRCGFSWTYGPQRLTCRSSVPQYQHPSNIQAGIWEASGARVRYLAPTQRRIRPPPSPGCTSQPSVARSASISAARTNGLARITRYRRMGSLSGRRGGACASRACTGRFEGACRSLGCCGPTRAHKGARVRRPVARFVDWRAGVGRGRRLSGGLWRG
ncbi:hypothetical protein GY45DRAFT_835022 [Cubamyces sp. BRFM 1775]|nr:hypothetical protein GY45DRAFT_835022 [Cubamyces sp. BRFM 1775]